MYDEDRWEEDQMSEENAGTAAEQGTENARSTEACQTAQGQTAQGQAVQNPESGSVSAAGAGAAQQGYGSSGMNAAPDQNVSASGVQNPNGAPQNTNTRQTQSFGTQNPYRQPGTGQAQNPYSQPNPYAQQTGGWQGGHAGTQNQQSYGQPGTPYGNPYPYHNYYQGAGQSNNRNANQAYNTNPVNANTGNGKSRRKNSHAQTAALVTAAALLFGVVSGGTMYTVNRAANTLFPAAESQTETQAAGNGAETQSGTQTGTQTGGQTAQTAVASGSEGNGSVILTDVSAVVDSAMPSVVAITNTQLLQSSDWFGMSQTYEVPSSGSGIIVGENDTELLIVTNNHVVEDANSLTVTFVDGSSIEAALKGTDSDTDLAVIAVSLDKISEETRGQIKAATLGDSDSLKLGEGVIAIGNALGKGQSVTVGCISALNREVTIENVQKTVIQTDAAINPGNSGGALLNKDGELIGINEAKYATTSVEGVGYAIPISNVKDIIDDLTTRTTKVAVDESERGYMGVQLRSVDANSAQIYGMPQGAFVYQILEDSPAANSDLREKDIITKLNGDSVTSSAELTELLSYYKSGETVTLTVQYQENGAYTEREVQVTLGSRPQEETETSQQENQGPQQGRRP